MEHWYKEKRDSHHKQWEVAQDLNKEKAAAYHMQEFINYSELYEQKIKLNQSSGV